MIKISEHYINEAIRIRKEYLDSVVYVNNYKEEIIYHKNNLENLRRDLVDKRNITESYFMSKMGEINNCISLIQSKINPYLDTIKKLDEEQRRLYINIKEKYINISDEDIVSNILPEISKITI
jgi:hypothetical protein